MTSRWITAWRVGALLLVAVVAAANVIHTAQRIPPPAAVVPASAYDPLSWQEQRFSRFRDRVNRHELPPTIGYIGDAAQPDDDFYYAQFAVLPLVLDGDPEPHPWALANLRSASPSTRISDRWQVVEDFGQGVLLLKKAAR